MMKDKDDRSVRWFDAIAVADNGRLLFSSQAEAMHGVISQNFNPIYYQAGIWLCSLTEFPQFANKNFFELTPAERAKTENSWAQLKVKFAKFMSTSNLK